MRDQRLIERAKHMRSEPSPLEQKMWLALRAKRFAGAKFRRQVVIGKYIADFACRTPAMIVVEVDGDSHAGQAAYDMRRTQFLEERGYRVLRFSNAEVGGNFEGVITIIQRSLPLSPALSPEGERGKDDRRC